MEFKTYQKRKKLADKLLLDTPFSIHICPSTYCNFKCRYCVHSLSNSYALPNGIKKEYMDISVFEKLINQIKFFPHKLKLLNFAYLGEPLLNKQLPEMIRMAHDLNVSDRIEIVSNSLMLNHRLSDMLIDSHLDRLRISIQGLNSDEYYNMSGVKIDYDNMKEEIRYFYNKSRGTETKVYLKTVDAVVSTEERRNIFYNDFGCIADDINIEGLIPISSECNIEDLKQEFEYGFFGNTIKNTNICSEIFYTLVVEPNGDIIPCCTMGKPPVILGNIRNDNIIDIWNGDKLKSLRKEMITNGYRNFPGCKGCGVPMYQTSEEDYLDDYKDEILKKLNLE